MTKATMLLTLAKHANRKALYYYDRMNQFPVFSGKHIDAGVRADQYGEYLSSIIKEAYETLPTAEYRKWCLSIAD